MIYPRKGLTACSHWGEMFFYYYLHYSDTPHRQCRNGALYTLYAIIQVPHRFPHTNPAEGLPSCVGEDLFLSANIFPSQVKQRGKSRVQ